MLQTPPGRCHAPGCAFTDDQLLDSILRSTQRAVGFCTVQAVNVNVNVSVLKCVSMCTGAGAGSETAARLQVGDAVQPSPDTHAASSLAHHPLAVATCTRPICLPG